MQIPEQLRSRLSLVRRVLLWTGMALLLFAGVFSNPFGTGGKQAWAGALACNNGGSVPPGNSSIPIVPTVLYLKYSGPPTTYQVSLCQDPTAPVEVTTNVDASDPITVAPSSLIFTNTVTKTFSVSIIEEHPADVAFSFVITHASTSNDPEFDYGSLNVPTVTVYYSPPVAVNDEAGAPHGQSISINVLGNDIDRLGQGLILPAGAIITNPENGTASVSVDQTLLYTPTAGFAGLDTFTYQLDDNVGNSDIATVSVNVAAAGASNPQAEPVNQNEETVIEFTSASGPVLVTIPPIPGLAPGANVVATFSEVATPIGDVDNPPVPGGYYSGISFNFELFVDGEPIDPDDLTEPITIEYPVPAEFAEGLDGARLILVVWNGTAWTTEGIDVQGLTDTPDGWILTFDTSVFGEFSLFIQFVIFVPYLEAN